MPQIPGGFELILILAVVLLLFGGNFKKSVKDEEPEVAKDEKAVEEPKKVEGSQEVAETEAPKETKQA